MSPLDLDRLANRIERLQRTSTHDWMPGDDMEFRKQLPTARVDPRFKLPDPQVLRAASKSLQMKEAIEFTRQDYQTANQRILRMESLVHQNKPTSMKRIMHDAVRGRGPMFRR